MVDEEFAIEVVVLMLHDDGCIALDDLLVVDELLVVVLNLNLSAALDVLAYAYGRLRQPSTVSICSSDIRVMWALMKIRLKPLTSG